MRQLVRGRRLSVKLWEWTASRQTPPIIRQRTREKPLLNGGEKNKEKMQNVSVTSSAEQLFLLFQKHALRIAGDIDS